VFESFSQGAEKNINAAVTAETDTPFASIDVSGAVFVAPPKMLSHDSARTTASTGKADICTDSCPNLFHSSGDDLFKNIIWPASSDNRFISETVTEALEQNLDKVNVSKETAEKVLREINVHGEQPEIVLKDLMAKNRVLAVGESHQTPNPQRDLVAQNMSALKEAGATHLAVEMPTNIQPILDDFFYSGQLDLDKLPNLIQTQDYLNLLQAARDNGIKIVAVDRSDQPADSGQPKPSNAQTEPLLTRDQTMAGNIGKILDQDPANKVVFFVGARHLNRSNIPGSRLAADYLRDRYDIATIKPDYANFRGEVIYPLSEITAGIKEPVAVSTERAKILGSLPNTKFNEEDKEYLRDWDFVFIYP
jgi:hypothetical protein